MFEEAVWDYTHSSNALRTVVQMSERTVREQFHRTDRKTIFTVLLSSVIGNAELFLSKTLHEYLRYFPELVGEDVKCFSYKQLRYLNSLSAAKEQIIESAVDQILQDAPQGWLIFLEWKAKVPMEILERDKNQLIEIYARRRLLVHQQGLVNSRYMSTVSAQARPNIEEGSVLECDVAYVEHAIGLFESALLQIASELTNKVMERKNSC